MQGKTRQRATCKGTTPKRLQATPVTLMMTESGTAISRPRSSWSRECLSFSNLSIACARNSGFTRFDEHAL